MRVAPTSLASVWLAFWRNFHKSWVWLPAEWMKVVTMGAPQKFRGLVTFNLFTFSRFSCSLCVLQGWRSAMSSRSTEHRAAAVSMESLSLLGFSAGKTYLVLCQLFWVDGVGLCLSSDCVLVFLLWWKSSAGEREDSVGEKGEIEGEGAHGLWEGLVLFWCWGVVRIGLVEEGYEVVLDGGGDCFSGRGHDFWGVVGVRGWLYFFPLFRGELLRECCDRVSWCGLLRKFKVVSIVSSVYPGWFFLLKLELYHDSWELC